MVFEAIDMRAGAEIPEPALPASRKDQPPLCER